MQTRIDNVSCLLTAIKNDELNGVVQFPHSEDFKALRSLRKYANTLGQEGISVEVIQDLIRQAISKHRLSYACILAMKGFMAYR